MIAEYIKLEWDKKRGANLSVGNLEVRANATVIPYRATVIARNAEVCQLNGMQQSDTYDLSVAFVGGESYLLKFWQQSTNLGTLKSFAKMVGGVIEGRGAAAFDNLIPKIIDDSGTEVGNIHVPVVKNGMGSFTYWQLELQDKKLDTYIVGVDKSIYFCMYDANQNMVATVEKRTPVKNGKSRYTMYIAEDNWLRPVVLMTSILHQQIYDEEDLQGLGSQSHRMTTIQSGLKDKYRPDFIAQIRSQENANNWPENMPLVQAKVSESQNTPQLILKRIGLIFFVIIFIVIFALVFLSK